MLLGAFSAPGPEARLNYESVWTDEHAGRSGSAKAPAKHTSAKWRLSVDLGAIADSNITNSTDEATIPIRYGDQVLPVPLDPALRAHGDIGLSVAAGGGVELPVAPGAWLVAEAEGFALDHEGGQNDDWSILASVGPMFRWGESEALVQALAFQRWYGGISANAGFGVRARYQEQLGTGQSVVLTVDARVFESGYGEAFDGSQAALYLSYVSVLDPVTTGSAGVYGRRDWLEGDSYSSAELGGYFGLSRFLGPDLSGSLSAGLSLIRFDEPILYLSAHAREDRRVYAAAAVTTRRPIGWGVYPSMSYMFNRTRSSVGFFNASRHRVRLGLRRAF